MKQPRRKKSHRVEFSSITFVGGIQIVLDLLQNNRNTTTEKLPSTALAVTTDKTTDYDHSKVAPMPESMSSTSNMMIARTKRISRLKLLKATKP